MLNFYTLESDRSEPKADPLWFEYEAKFSEGVLQAIECVEIHLNSITSADRQQRCISDVRINQHQLTWRSHENVQVLQPPSVGLPLLLKREAHYQLR